MKVDRSDDSHPSGRSDESHTEQSEVFEYSENLSEIDSDVSEIEVCRAGLTRQFPPIKTRLVSDFSDSSDTEFSEISETEVSANSSPSYRYSEVKSCASFSPSECSLADSDTSDLSSTTGFDQATSSAKSYTDHSGESLSDTTDSTDSSYSDESDSFIESSKESFLSTDPDSDFYYSESESETDISEFYIDPRKLPRSMRKVAKPFIGVDLNLIRREILSKHDKISAILNKYSKRDVFPVFIRSKFNKISADKQKNLNKSLKKLDRYRSGPNSKILRTNYHWSLKRAPCPTFLLDKKCLKDKYNHEEVEVVLDTGATHSVLSENLLKRLSKNCVVKCRPQPFRINIDASGNIMKILDRAYDIKISLKEAPNKTLHLRSAVVHKVDNARVNNQILLGIADMQRPNYISLIHSHKTDKTLVLLKGKRLRNQIESAEVRTNQYARIDVKVEGLNQKIQNLRSERLKDFVEFENIDFSYPKHIVDRKQNVCLKMILDRFDPFIDHDVQRNKQKLLTKFLKTLLPDTAHLIEK